ncbi:MAG: hypothetical protein CMF63_08215 [Magnetovibrio sp.]|jgi:hypothetical protein|nr:hypothetical protein [Magnetovibrio sp.]
MKPGKRLNLNAINKAALRDMPRFLDATFGAGNWFFDEGEKLYIAKNPKHRGKGFGFFAIRPDGSWFKGVVPEGRFQ